MRKHIKMFFTYLELIIVAIIVLIPVLWIVGSSFGNSSSLANAKMIPENPTIQNYVNLFKDTNFKLWYGNTLKVATVNINAESSEENPRYCDIYVGSQKTTVVLTIPVIKDITVNFIILLSIRSFMLPLSLGRLNRLYFTMPFFS